MSNAWRLNPKRRSNRSKGQSASSSRNPGRGPAPRKKLGQHFLISNEILDRIIEAADLAPSTTVVEVGPGLGVVTTELLQRAGKVIAVEIDENLCRHLEERFGDRDNLSLVCNDILRITPQEMLDAGEAQRPYTLVGNLPYYITAPILRHFLESNCQPSHLVIMLQREVAQNILAHPGEMSLLAVSVQFYAVPELVTAVPATAFYPPPEVESAVIRLNVRPRPAVDVGDDLDGFFSVVRAGFRAPRKQLHNALPQGLWLEAGEAEVLLHDAEIDSMRRAQTLSLEEWERLWRAYRGRHPKRREAA